MQRKAGETNIQMQELRHSTTKGYFSKALWEMLLFDVIQLFTKLKKNMKNHIMKMEDKILIRKRTIIETINDE